MPTRGMLRSRAGRRLARPSARAVGSGEGGVGSADPFHSQRRQAPPVVWSRRRVHLRAARGRWTPLPPRRSPPPGVLRRAQAIGARVDVPHARRGVAEGLGEGPRCVAGRALESLARAGERFGVAPGDLEDALRGVDRFLERALVAADRIAEELWPPPLPTRAPRRFTATLPATTRSMCGRSRGATGTPSVAAPVMVAASARRSPSRLGSRCRKQRASASLGTAT